MHQGCILTITITPTKAEDTIPACYVAPPVGEQNPTPPGQQQHRKAVGEHLDYGSNEVLGACRDFLLQTPKPGLKEYGGNSWRANVKISIKKKNNKTKHLPSA